MKIHPLGAEIFHADGRMDKHDEANSLFFFKIVEKRLKREKSRAPIGARTSLRL